MKKKFTKIASLFCLLFLTLAINDAYAQTCADCVESCIQIDIVADEYPGENAWTLTDDTNTVIASGDGTTQNVVVCVAAGACFEFTMTDTFGDGQFGSDFGGVDGSTSIEYDGVVQFTSTGNWGTEISGIIGVGCAINGCTDPLALNFDPAANTDDGSCIVPACAGVAFSYCYDSNEASLVTYTEANPGDGVIIEVLSGAVEAGFDTFTIYDGADDLAPVLFSGDGDLTGVIAASTGASITIGITSDGSVSCVSGSQPAINYNMYCGAVTNGCTDPLACNFDAAANFDDGSCDFSCYGCTDAGACNFDATATLDDGNCDFSCVGCTDPLACNFDAAFTIADPASCCFDNCITFDMTDSFGDGWNGNNYEVFDANTNTLVASGDLDNAQSGDGLSVGTDNLCLVDGCYNLVINAGGFTGEVGWTLSGANEAGLTGGSPASIFFSVGTGVCNVGCTDATACNFDGTATIDDGSCDFVSCAGCTDPLAANFDPAATIDDGTCVTCAPGELLVSIDMEDTFGDGWDGTEYFLTTDLGALIAQGDLDGALVGDGTSVGTDLLCLAPGCYVFDVAGGSFPTEKIWSVSDNLGTTYASGTGLIAGQGLDIGLTGGCAFTGCTDPTAVNFDLNAGVDDGSCLFAPDNDEICNAEAVTCGSSVIGTTALSTDAEALVGTVCSGETVTSSGVWYEFNAAADQQIFVSTCGSTSGIDTKITVYEATDCNGTLNCVVMNDDSGSCPAGSFLSEAVFNAETGNNYFIYVSEFGTGAGLEFNLDITCVDCTDGVPANDLCADATPLISGLDVTQSLCCASAATENVFAPAFTTTYDVWFVVNSGTFDAVSISVENIDAANAGVTIYDGADCLALNASAGGGPVTGEIAGDLSDFVTVTPSTDYLIQVWTTDPLACGDVVVNATGNFLGCTDPAAVNFDPLATLDDGNCDYTGVTPANDLCADALPLPCNAITSGSTGGATATGAPLGVANCDASPGTGVWYTFVGTGELHTLSACGSVIDSKVNVYESDADCAGVLSCVASGNEGAVDCGFFDADDFSVEFISTLGVNYYVYVGAEDADADPLTDDNGLFDLDFTCAPIVEGCTNPVACDFDPAANVDTGCDFLSCACDANPTGFGVQLNMSDSFGDGWNGNTYDIISIATGTSVATGDLDGAIFSIDEDNFAGPESGFDILCLDAGCYDIVVGGGAFAGEVSWELVDALGGIIASGGAETVSFSIGGAVCGCTDATACNFDALADTDDGSCEFTSCAGCTDAAACNFDATATIDDGSCCTDNCVTFNMTDSFGDGWNGAVYEIYDAASNALVASGDLDNAATGDGTTSGTDILCLVDGCYYLTVTAGDFAGEISWTLIGANSGIASGGAPTDQEFFSVGTGDCVVGCAEPVACNFDPATVIADCSLCEYDSCQGCTYEDADNYDATALIDDGSCTGLAGSCPSDFNGDGIVNGSDLLLFLGDFGGSCD
jgi:hypothetical protein